MQALSTHTQMPVPMKGAHAMSTIITKDGTEIY